MECGNHVERFAWIRNCESISVAESKLRHQSDEVVKQEHEVRMDLKKSTVKL